MHAAKPALAMEQATVSISTVLKSAEGRYTSDLSLATTLRSRNGTSTLEQHSDGLNI